MKKSVPKSVDEYIAAQPEAVRLKFEQARLSGHNPRRHAGIDPLPHSAEVSALPVRAAAVWAAQELIVQ